MAFLLKLREISKMLECERMYVELKPESDPETPLQDRKPSTAQLKIHHLQALIYRRSDLQDSIKEQSLYSDKLKNESVPNVLSIQRGMKTVRVSNKYHAKKNESHSVIEAKLRVTAGVCTTHTLDLFNSSCHWILAQCLLAVFGTHHGKKYSTRSISVL